VKPLTSPAIATIIDCRSAYGAEAFSFYIQSGVLNAWAGAYSNVSALRTGGTVPTGVWSHVAFVRHNGVNMLFLNGQKVGVDNREPVKNLMEQIYGNKNDHDFNRMMSGLISVIEENNLVDKVKHQVVIAPKKKTLSLKEIQYEALKKEISQLRKEVSQ